MTNTKTDASLEKQDNQALQRAIDYLGAQEVAPGRIAVPENGRWFILTPHDVCIIAEDRPEVFTGGSVRMPAWWSPDRQTAYRDGHGRVYTREQLDASPGSLLTEYITCDLTTGEEAPA